MQTKNLVVSQNIVARIVNDSGRAFNVRLVREGEHYGLNDCLTHDNPSPLVEFWDATYENDPRFTLGRGQFVQRYYLATLQRDRGRAGLDLCFHVDAWKINATNVRDAVASCELALGLVR